MNRDALAPALIALLCVFALGVGASSLDSPTSSGGGSGSGGGSVGPGQGSAFDLGQPVPIDAPSNSPTILKLVFQLLAAALIVAFFVSLYLTRDELSLRHLGIVAVGSLVFAGALGVLYLLLGLFGDGSAGEGGLFGERAPTLPGGGGDTSLDGATRTLTADPLMLALVLGVALLVGIVVALQSGEDNDEAESEPTPAGQGTAMAGIGRAAGRAADRITADAAVENEVYRAWREMTTHVDVENPQSSTPDEFARAATDAGMAREDVNELTGLFQTVRYGGSSVTDEREAHAVAALRRIESEYAEAS